jgi:hypothetical protein
MFEKRVLRRIFGQKRVAVTREWRRLHNEELYDWLIKSKRMMRGTVTRRGQREKGDI